MQAPAARADTGAGTSDRRNATSTGTDASALTHWRDVLGISAGTDAVRWALEQWY